MSQKDKPDPKHVARWVAAGVAPEPSKWNREEWKAWRKAKDHGRGQLAGWGLGPDGSPKEAA